MWLSMLQKPISVNGFGRILILTPFISFYHINVVVIDKSEEPAQGFDEKHVRGLESKHQESDSK